MRNKWIAVATLGVILCGCSSSPPAKNPETAPVSTTEKKPTQAPEQYSVKVDTTKGAFTIHVTRAWAPHGADRFYELVQAKFFDDEAFFRVVRNFVVQFGINKDTKVNGFWSNMNIPDDPVKQSNRRGTVTFATAGPNTRTTQVFVNLRDNRTLDKQGFAPFGNVSEGLDVVARLYGGYGDMPPGGEGPDPTKIETQGNQYLTDHFPRLDYTKTARVE